MYYDLKSRLACGNAILRLLDLRRAQTGDPELGWSIEKRIVDRELDDLEELTARPRAQAD